MSPPWKFGSLLILACAVTVIPLTIANITPAKYTSIAPAPNSTCKGNTDCDSQWAYRTYLKCLKGRCKCESNSLYDDYEGSCRIKYSSQCTIKRSPEDKIQPCVRYAQCAYPLSFDGHELKNALHGTCQCIVGRKPNPDDGSCSGSRLVSSSSFITSFLLTTLAIVLPKNFLQR